MARFLVLMLVGLLVSTNVFAQSINDGRYVVTSRFSGKSLEVASASADNGANIQQWLYGGQEWQQFDIEYQGSGYYSIINAYTGKSLDVYELSLEAGANIVQWDYWAGDGQLWAITEVESGFYTLTSKLSGMNLDVWEWNESSGGDIRQYTATGLTNQQWSFTPVGTDVVSGYAAISGSDGLSTTTGGGSASATTVTTCSELVAAATDSAARVIYIPDYTIDCRTADRAQEACEVQCSGQSKYTYRVPVGTQTCTELGSTTDATVTRTRNETRILVASNKTIVGLGSNSKLLGASFHLGDVQNVIFRNFTIEDVNPGLVEAGGGISMDNSSHIWIDHMRFALISDGYTDMVTVKNVTLSWNHFDGYNEASCDNHHSYVMFADDTTVTFHHNFFDQGGGRNPKLNKSETRAHLYNNYWYDITYFALNTGNDAQARIEGCYYDGVSRPHWNESGAIDANMSTNVYVNTSTSSYADTGDTVFDVPYAYTVDSASSLPSVLSSGTGPQ